MNLGKLVKISPAENSSQEWKIILDKYSANFVIVLWYEVPTYYEVLHC